MNRFLFKIPNSQNLLAFDALLLFSKRYGWDFAISLSLFDESSLDDFRTRYKEILDNMTDKGLDSSLLSYLPYEEKILDGKRILTSKADSSRKYSNFGDLKRYLLSPKNETSLEQRFDVWASFIKIFVFLSQIPI